MPPHIIVLATINAFRAACGLAFGLILVRFSDETSYPAGRLLDLETARPRFEPADFTAFLVVGIVILTIAVLRGFQGLTTFVEMRRARRGGERRRGRMSVLSRRLGFGLSVLDLVDVTLFPITTACGLYGLLVYRHPDTVDFYEGRFSP